MGSINNISSSLIQSALQAAGLNNPSTKTTASISTASLTQTLDNSQLSPLARVLSTLQQLQQTDPTKYQQVTAQIATNLQDAAQTAQASGNTSAASQLSQLSTDFSTASKTGQLPNIQDLAQAIGGTHHGHHHGHHSHAADNDGDSSSSASSSTSTTASTTGTTASGTSTTTGSSASQASSQSFDPAAIILNTLTSAGVTGSTS